MTFTPKSNDDTRGLQMQRRSRREPESSVGEESLNELSARVREFCDKRQWGKFHTIKNLAIGVVTESAELLEPFRFLNEQESLEHISTSEGRENLEDELADVLFFLLRISDRHQVELGSALKRKLKKNALKYPVRQSKKT